MANARNKRLGQVDLGMSLTEDNTVTSPAEESAPAIEKAEEPAREELKPAIIPEETKADTIKEEKPEETKKEEPAQEEAPKKEKAKKRVNNAFDTNKKRLDIYLKDSTWDKLLCLKDELGILPSYTIEIVISNFMENEKSFFESDKELLSAASKTPISSMKSLKDFKSEKESKRMRAVYIPEGIDSFMKAKATGLGLSESARGSLYDTIINRYLSKEGYN